MGYRVTGVTRGNNPKAPVRINIEEFDQPIYCWPGQLPEGLSVDWVIDFTFDVDRRWADKTGRVKYMINQSVPVEVIARSERSALLDEERKKMGFNLDEIYSSGNYLKGEDLKGEIRDVTIENVELVTFDGDKGPEQALCLKYAGVGKLHRLSFTKVQAVREMLGDDTDQWKGKTIKIFPEKYNFKGNEGWTAQIMSVRVPQATPPTSAPEAFSQPSSTPVAPPAEDPELKDDDIPW